jgi:hypothetical protein
MCKYRNLPYALTCQLCGCYMTPTRVYQQAVTYQILSFGSHTDRFLCCQKHHSDLFKKAVQVPRDGRNVAIRVGVDSSFAITIKDANSTLRSTLRRILPPPSMAHSKLDAFIEASRFILDTDPNKTSGTEPQLQLCQNDNSKYS